MRALDGAGRGAYPALMMKYAPFLMILGLSFAPPPAGAAEEGAVGRVTGRPIPRFESLKFDETRMRVGPGKDYRTLWVYKRKGLPLQVTEEYDVWLRARDSEGAEGWISSNQLSLRRMALATSAFDLRKREEAGSGIVAHVEAGAVLRLLGCAATVCRLQAEGLEGWADKAALWGVAAGEVF